MFLNRWENLWFFMKLFGFTEDMGFGNKINANVMISTRGRLFMGFEGIRYAQPPVGNLRFKDPEPFERFDSIRRQVDCLQFDPTTEKMIGQEDCLFLNIYTPVKFMSVKMPVLIWIYGSPFYFGNSANSLLGAERLSNYDIVIVMINYRVGPLGFASYENSTLPGNLGLKDQLMAIEWVFKNIRKFGGDPNRVTLGGIGSGAAHVLFHLNGVMNGRINKGIAIGGSRFAPWAFGKPSWVKMHTELLAQSVNCKYAKPKMFSSQFPYENGLGQNISILLPTHRCNASLDDDNLAQIAYQAERHIPFWDKIIQPFQPVIDGHIIPGNPRDFNGKHKFSLLLGLNRDEGGFMVSYAKNNELPKEEVKSAFESFFRDGVVRDRKLVMYNTVVNENITSLYNHFNTTDDKLSAITSDGWFLLPAMAEAKFHNGPLKAFMFGDYFGWKHMDCSVERKIRQSVHGDQLPFIFFIYRCRDLSFYFNMVADGYTDVIADFVSDRNVRLRTYQDDQDTIFDLTKALRNPDEFKWIDHNLSARMHFWSKLIK
ncbi:cholinesterase 1-like [Cimex lectularius]|uniref:Carboxylesterase type B domain-containing protein n=1 Tax=Cimex lectularius TaxID=79782 RepID=A0A8I6TJU0_CIMLE|nr:cholinesterase 1-like [Cimex lectularius]